MGATQQTLSVLKIRQRPLSAPPRRSWVKSLPPRCGTPAGDVKGVPSPGQRSHNLIDDVMLASDLPIRYECAGVEARSRDLRGNLRTGKHAAEQVRVGIEMFRTWTSASQSRRGGALRTRDLDQRPDGFVIRLARTRKWRNSLSTLVPAGQSANSPGPSGNIKDPLEIERSFGVGHQ